MARLPRFCPSGLPQHIIQRAKEIRGQVWSPAVLAQIAVDGSVQQQTSVSTTA
jgi:hypothetical protein